MLRYAAAAALMGLAALMAPALAAADTVTQWNQNAATSLYVTAAQPPNVSVLHMAMVQGALVYDAVNAIDGGREGYLLTSRVATPTDSKDAATATAAYKTLLEHRSGSGAGADGALQRLACGHRGRCVQDTRHGGGQRRGGSDGRRPAPLTVASGCRVS